jgi:hypothetical protein
MQDNPSHFACLVLILERGYIGFINSKENSNEN